MVIVIRLFCPCPKPKFVPPGSHKTYLVFSLHLSFTCFPTKHITSPKPFKLSCLLWANFCQELHYCNKEFSSKVCSNQYNIFLLNTLRSLIYSNRLMLFLDIFLQQSAMEQIILNADTKDSRGMISKKYVLIKPNCINR